MEVNRANYDGIKEAEIYSGPKNDGCDDDDSGIVKERNYGIDGKRKLQERLKLIKSADKENWTAVLVYAG